MAHPGCNIVPQVREGTHFHLALRVLIFSSHMWQQGDLGEIEEPRVYLRFIWINIEASRRKLTWFKQW